MADLFHHCSRGPTPAHLVTLRSRPSALALARSASGTLCLTLAVAITATAQTTFTPPRTPDGRPDLQGIWYFGSATPLERPAQFADKPVLTKEEAEAWVKREAERISRIQAVHAPGWLDYGTNVDPDLRSSLITDPPDGRVPALTPEARATQTARAAERRGVLNDGPESFNPQERCLVFGAGPPILPGPYNNNLQIVQTADHVVVYTEMIHDARIVRLGPTPQGAPPFRSWLGWSHGRWEGDTLVVETTHFRDEVVFRGSDESLRVIERMRLEGPNALRYEFTIDNPTAFTRPWTASFTMTRTPDQMYEYACHEGNYGLPNILQGARYVERTSAPR